MTRAIHTFAAFLIFVLGIMCHLTAMRAAQVDAPTLQIILEVSAIVMMPMCLVVFIYALSPACDAR